MSTCPELHLRHMPNLQSVNPLALSDLVSHPYREPQPRRARRTPTSRRSTSTTWMNPTRPRHWLIGVGEVGITDADAAIANAVHRATGKRVRDLPITPNELL